uniref:Uncharacterized protein n=1 Tax=Aplanochytrium stocchinoi TaxID=215587 RepID=A0A7S3LN49_9STRA|mmetsp:Transcript_18452/g.22616  ORF Transcript_18452/g.22616 Transcript_18452/m.22616 type:complete len:203 (+) Transcript_18452:84-692(+)|eukprot:CAMPEP_0204873338 /NCGR_PEP_ID=MMETSP1348-20121228/40354_1 /ASSEMBLY_ACC=CAM_ASM_000700 /TAXON_ID=215587 /ORGANISM="Aplanochytrium stocchinoi, Strain GSBS06" /LENGTH=202 /DNA_ID=CAMNT_0052028615 /DNA_START=199 /DNA_END=807 /DNA_ORIENTATION=-
MSLCVQLLESVAETLQSWADKLEDTLKKNADVPQPLTFKNKHITKYTCCTENPAETVAWLVKYLELPEIEVPDDGLKSVGTRWIRLPSKQELHFVSPWGNSSEIWRQHNDEVSRLDKECTVWTPWMINHPAYTVKDVTPLVKRLVEDKQPFFGPVMREDGVYQIYIRVPHSFYMEVDSAKYDPEVGGKPVTTWATETARSFI